MRVCDICRKTLDKNTKWWTVSFSTNSPGGEGNYFELCTNHKSQMLEILKLKIEEASKC